MSRRPIIFFALCLSLLSARAMAQSASETLTLDRAIQLSLEHNPTLKSAAANLRAADAGVTLALSAYYPALNATASATRTDGWFVFNPSFAPKTQTYNSYSTGVGLSQLLYDFGKTGGHVSSNDYLDEAARKDLRATRNVVVMNVRVAYLACLQSDKLETVAVETLDQAKKHFTQASAFYSVGRRPQLDVTKTEVDLSSAEVNLIRARNQSRLARLQLENAIGMHFTAPYVLEDVSEDVTFSVELEPSKALAVTSRPDLQSTLLRYQSLRATASSLWAQHLPTVSGTAGYNWSGFDFPLRGRWTAGVTLAVPLFQGFGISAAATQAEAAADAALAMYAQTKDNVLLDVEQNFLAVQEALERRHATAKLVEQATENLRLAEKQYAAGVATPMEVTDATVSLAGAKTTHIQALFDAHAALSRLKRAIGTE